MPFGRPRRALIGACSPPAAIVVKSGRPSRFEGVSQYPWIRWRRVERSGNAWRARRWSDWLLNTPPACDSCRDAPAHRLEIAVRHPIVLGALHVRSLVHPAFRGGYTHGLPRKALALALSCLVTGATFAGGSRFIPRLSASARVSSKAPAQPQHTCPRPSVPCGRLDRILFEHFPRRHFLRGLRERLSSLRSRSLGGNASLVWIIVWIIVWLVAHAPHTLCRVNRTRRASSSNCLKASVPIFSRRGGHWIWTKR